MLQGVGDYKARRAQPGRRAGGAAGRRRRARGRRLGVTGAYLGSLVSYVAMSRLLLVQLRATPPRTEARARAGAGNAGVSACGRHVKRAWAPIAGLAVIAVLQNIDIIAAKHRFTEDTASSYAAAAVAAKVLIWVAIGAGFYLVPEVSRRRAGGRGHAAGAARALAIVAVCAVPCLLIFAVGAAPAAQRRVRARSGDRSGSLLVLGAAFTVLAATYLAVQYMLALKRTWFLVAARLRRGGRADAAAPRLQAARGLRGRRARRPGGRRAARVRARAAAADNAPPARRRPRAAGSPRGRECTRRHSRRSAPRAGVGSS